MKTVIKKTENFTMVHNNLIFDESISWKAKGILLYMLSRPSNWRYNAKEIAKNSKDGLDSVYSGLKELVKERYVSRKKNADGTINYYIFEDKSENNIRDYQDKEEIEEKEKEEKEPDTENPNLDNPNLEKPDMENPNQENPNLDFPHHNNIDNTNIEYNNIDSIYLYRGKEFQKAFSDFKIMRIGKKEPLSKPAEDLILMKLHRLAGNNEQLAIEILNKSTINSWKDIFPLDKKQGGNNNGNTGNKRSYTRNTEKKGFDKHNDYKPDYSKGFDDWN